MRLTLVSRLSLFTLVTRHTQTRNSRFLGCGHPSPHSLQTNMQRHMTSSSKNGSPMDLRHIGLEEMTALVQDYEDRGRADTGMIIIDVRNPEEIASTGKLSPNTISMPLPIILQYDIFALDEEEFEEVTGFDKPALDETIVFSCAAGIRSVYAANYAAQQGGYTKFINYMGGAYEWFSPR